MPRSASATTIVAMSLPNSYYHIAIETTGRTGSLAILADDLPLWHRQLPSDQRTAAVLTPSLAEMLEVCRQRQWSPSWITVASGPGSFTGLRIGITTAKSLSYATGWPILSVDSLSSIAATVATERIPTDPIVSRIIVGLNAYRGEVFAAEFEMDSLLRPSFPPAADQIGQSSSGENQVAEAHFQRIAVMNSDSWAAWCADRSAHPNTLFAGDDSVLKQVPIERIFRRTLPDAIGVGRIGLRATEGGKWEDAFSLRARYFKRSAAEEKANPA